MNFFEQIVQQTEQQRAGFVKAPLIEQCFRGDVKLDDYVAFLAEAYHHVKHTVPLLMAVGSRLPESKEWLRTAVAEYIEEEMGHQEWILNDIAACGYDKELVRAGSPSLATELMVSYAYDQVQRKNPVGFFGMVYVLEGTSINLADQAASVIQQQLGLPGSAFTYLRSHGAIDQEHVKFFEILMNQIVDEDDQKSILHCANVFFELYGNIFRTLGSNPDLVPAATAGKFA